MSETVASDRDRDGTIGGLSVDVGETPIATATAASTAAMLSALCLDNLNMFTRAVGSRRASLRQLLGGEKPQLSVDTVGARRGSLRQLLGGEKPQLSVDTVGSRRGSLRQLLGGEKPQLSVDTGSVVDSPTQVISGMNIRGQKLMIRSASVSPIRGHSTSATNVRRVNFFPGDVNVLRRGVSGSDIPLHSGSISEKVGPSTLHLRSLSSLGVTSEKVSSTAFKKMGKPGSFVSTLTALPPELRGSLSSDRLEDSKRRIYPSGSMSAAKSSTLSATAKPLRCRSIDAIVPRSSEKISSTSKKLMPKMSEKILAKNLLVPLSSTVQHV